MTGFSARRKLLRMPPRKLSAVDRYDQLSEELRAGTLRPIYFLAGEERLLVDRVLAGVRRLALVEGLDEFNHDQLSAPAAGAAGILTAARTVPMMAERRLVEVRDAELLKAPELERLLPYVEAPVDSTVLVFVASKIDARLKFFRALDKQGYLARFDAVRGAPLRRFLESEAERAGARLGPGVADLIIELAGNDFLGLASAVEKLCLYAGEGQTVQAEHVDAVIAQTRQAVIFELTDAVGEGNVDVALTSLGSLLQSGEPEVRVLFMIARQLRMIWTALEALQAGTPQTGLAQALGVPPFVARKVAGQARRFDLPTVRAAHAEIYRADRALKRVRLPRHLILERLIMGLCVARRGGAVASPRRAR